MRRITGKPEKRLRRYLCFMRIECPNAQFEAFGHWFLKETGMLRPGKSQPAACCGTPGNEERQNTWNTWLADLWELKEANEKAERDG